MSLGASRLKKRILALVVGLCSINLISCGGASGTKQPPSGLHNRVLASQGVNTATSYPGLYILNGYNDTIPRVSPIGAGANPGLMAISPSRNIVTAFDSSTNTVYAVNTITEAGIGSVKLPGPSNSMVVPTSLPIGYAAVPSASVNDYSFTGALEAMNFSNNSLLTIAVPNAQTVVTNASGSQFLVFSNGSDSVTVVSAASASPPVDTSCLINPPNNVCTVVPGFDRPVNAIINGTTAYIFNCGAECGGVQASIQTLDLSTLTAGVPLPVNGATYGLLQGSTLYVAGNGTPTGQTCASLTNPINPVTAATYCGTLDIVDLTSMTDPYFQNPATEIAIPDGFHYQMDLTFNGQLFVGSRDCTNIGNATYPSGEVRGCLAIYNLNTNTLVIPPENGDVNGLQGFTTRYIEYVAQGGSLDVYDTTRDILLINDYLPEGTINVVGYIGDVKAVDFF